FLSRVLQFLNPLWAQPSTARTAGSGLSAARGEAMEGEPTAPGQGASRGRGPVGLVARRVPGRMAGQAQGRAFFWFLFFARAKKRNPPSRAEPVLFSTCKPGYRTT